MGKMKNRYEIKKLDFTIDGGYNYDVQIWSSTDGGETYFHCGLGKFCRTLEEALAYKAGMNVIDHCPKAPAVMKRAIRFLSAILGGICGEVTA